MQLMLWRAIHRNVPDGFCIFHILYSHQFIFTESIRKIDIIYDGV